MKTNLLFEPNLGHSLAGFPYDTLNSLPESRCEEVRLIFVRHAKVTYVLESIRRFTTTFSIKGLY